MTWEQIAFIAGAVAFICLGGYLGFKALRRQEGSDE